MKLKARAEQTKHFEIPPGSDFASGLAPGLADKGERKTRRRTKMISAILQLVPPSTGWVRGSVLDLRFAQDGERGTLDGESHEKDFL